MSGISVEQRNTLVEFARSAFGSGLTEGKDGGRGFMGVYKDSNGKTHTIKLLTHIGEGGSGSIKKLSEQDQAKIDDMTRGLRSSLVEIAQSTGGEAMKNVYSYLKLDKDGETTDKTPRFLERTIVAKVISEIAKQTGEEIWGKIDRHHRASTVDNTKLSAVLEDLEKIERKNRFGLRTEYSDNQLLGIDCSRKYMYQHPKNGIMTNWKTLCGEVKSNCKGKSFQYAFADGINQFSLKSPTFEFASPDARDAYLEFLKKANDDIESATFEDSESVTNLIQTLRDDLQDELENYEGLWDDMDTFLAHLVNECLGTGNDEDPYREIV